MFGEGSEPTVSAAQRVEKYVRQDWGHTAPTHMLSGDSRKSVIAKARVTSSVLLPVSVGPLGCKCPRCHYCGIRGGLLHPEIPAAVALASQKGHLLTTEGTLTPKGTLPVLRGAFDSIMGVRQLKASNGSIHARRINPNRHFQRAQQVVFGVCGGMIEDVARGMSARCCLRSSIMGQCTNL